MANARTAHQSDSPAIIAASRRGFELYNRRNIDAMVELYSDDVIWDMRATGLAGAGLYVGRQGLRRFLEDWLEVFPDATIGIETEETDPKGEWALIGLVQKVTGGKSGARVPFRYAAVAHWDGSHLTLVEHYTDMEEARKAFEDYAAGRASPG